MSSNNFGAYKARLKKKPFPIYHYNFQMVMHEHVSDYICGPTPDSAKD
jgi:hypothetical protein